MEPKLKDSEFLYFYIRIVDALTRSPLFVRGIVKSWGKGDAYVSAEAASRSIVRRAGSLLRFPLARIQVIEQA